MGLNCVVVPMLKYVGLGVLGQEIFSNLSTKDSLESERNEDIMKSESGKEKKPVDVRLDSGNGSGETEFVQSSSSGEFQLEGKGIRECQDLEQNARFQDLDSVSSLSNQESLWEAAEHIQERLDQITSSILELRADSSYREKVTSCERVIELEVHCSSIENQLNDIIRHGFLHALPQARNCDEYHRRVLFVTHSRHVVKQSKESLERCRREWNMRDTSFSCKKTENKHLINFILGSKAHSS